MTPWGYIGAGLALLAVCLVVAAIGATNGNQILVAGALLVAVAPVVLICVGVIGQGVKVSRNR